MTDFFFGDVPAHPCCDGDAPDLLELPRDQCPSSRPSRDDAEMRVRIAAAREMDAVPDEVVVAWELEGVIWLRTLANG